MNEQDDLVNAPDFQEGSSAEEKQQRNFVAAMNRARNEDAPLQVFQDLLNDAPPMSVEALHDLTARSRFLFHTNVLRSLLEYEPKIARHKDPRYGLLLLHRAIKIYKNIPVDTIELILDAYPDAISEKDKNGLLPLHLAFVYRRPLQILELLLSRYPDAAGVSPEGGGGWAGKFPLHRCLQSVKINGSESFIFSLIEAFPGAASIKTRHNETTLHLACKWGLSLVVIQRLYQLYPEAVNVQSDYYSGALPHQIPLHVACQSEVSSVEVVKFLAEKCPEGAQSKDRFGQSPLHYAVERRAPPLEVIQTLIEACPNAVNVTDNDGLLPLHAACHGGATLEVIQLLLHHYPGDEEHNNGLSITDNRGRLPIHWHARSENARADTLQHLLDLYPEGIHAVDRDGMLPLHHACFAIKPLILEIVCLLVEAAPFTVIQESAYGRTPLQFTRERGWLISRQGNDEVETYLIQRQNEAINAMKEAFADVANTRLGLPDLVIANVWSFAKPHIDT